MARSSAYPKQAKNSPNSPAVKEFVSKRRPTLLGVVKLMKSIDKLMVPSKSFKEARDAYSAKDIDKFIRERKIPVPFSKGLSIWGCYQQSIVLYYSMRSLGFRPRIFREILEPGIVHTSIWFRHKGKLYEADPFYNGKVYEVDPIRKEEVKSKMKKRRFAFIQPGEYTYQDYKQERKRNKLKKYF